MKHPARPLSPHLSIYRWPITMTLSILHRASGVAMSLGLLVFAAWLLAVSGNASGYSALLEILQTPLGRVALIGWSAAFFFHLANGIRHLIWDAGRGFEKSQANRSAWFVVAFTVAATVLYWWLQ